jgi:phage-related protein
MISDKIIMAIVGIVIVVVILGLAESRKYLRQFLDARNERKRNSNRHADCKQFTENLASIDKLSEPLQRVAIAKVLSTDPDLGKYVTPENCDIHFRSFQNSATADRTRSLEISSGNSSRESSQDLREY